MHINFELEEKEILTILNVMVAYVEEIRDEPESDENELLIAIHQSIVLKILKQGQKDIKDFDVKLAEIISIHGY